MPHTHTKYKKLLKTPNDWSKERTLFLHKPKNNKHKKKQKDWSKERTLFVHKPKYNSKKKKAKRLVKRVREDIVSNMGTH